MGKILIGRAESGRPVEIDLEILLRTRLLVQANSGGGKSWLIRRLAEQLFGRIPVLIIDPEGEFATLREKYGYVLVGKGGETPADTRSAGLVAQRLLELRASAVCDLYEMKPRERHLWVRLFLEALIDAPKSLWRPTIVMVDEAHTFCPEKGAGESEASDAMTALPTRGRKRRFCAVWATQRLGKLRKDASAELLNRLIGPTFEDVDLKRAADLLSITAEDRKAFDRQMRVLEPGSFYALGRAITKERVLVRVGGVATSHEIEQAKHGAEPPPPPEKVKALLPKLSDLPKQAEEKVRTEAELRREIAELRRQLTAKRDAKPATVDQKVTGLVTELRKAVERAMKFILQVNVEEIPGQIGAAEKAALQKTIADAVTTATRLLDRKLEEQRRQFARLKADGERLLKELKALAGGEIAVQVEVRRQQPFAVSSRPSARGAAVADLPKGEALVLTAIAQHQDVSRQQITVLTGYKRSTRDAYIQRLRERGALTVQGDRLTVAPAGLDALGPGFERLPTGAALREHWLQDLPRGERELFRIVVDAYPAGVSREVLSEKSGYKRSTRDAYLQRLSARELILMDGRGEVRASEGLFE